ncbi:hypothetical protein KCP75_00070 [Salmonella enterica subsp. enterica]|nr:hypothetical protein KCP75_00070 [Salmonella enterica subsp. enterica]
MRKPRNDKSCSVIAKAYPVRPTRSGTPYPELCGDAINGARQTASSTVISRWKPVIFVPGTGQRKVVCWLLHKLTQRYPRTPKQSHSAVFKYNIHGDGITREKAFSTCCRQMGYGMALANPFASDHCRAPPAQPRRYSDAENDFVHRPPNHGHADCRTSQRDK